jgi:hypothetical protein
VCIYTPPLSFRCLVEHLFLDVVESSENWNWTGGRAEVLLQFTVHIFDAKTIRPA